ncbi:MAG: ATP-binding protein [Pseudomonadota bacterium]
MGKDDGMMTRDRKRHLHGEMDFTVNLFESLTGYAVIVADFDGNILAYNEGARRMYGYATEEVVGKQRLEMFFPENFIRAGKLHELIKRLMADGGLFFEGEKVRKNGDVFPAQISFAITRDRKRRMAGFVEIVQDLTDRKRAEAALRRHGLLEAINRIFKAALVRGTSEELARTCLAAAVELTGSRYGFIGELTGEGLFDITAISGAGRDACGMPADEAAKRVDTMGTRGIWRGVLERGESLVANSPAFHPDSTGTPEGHPPVASLLCVALKQSDRTIGLIALAGKEPGFGLADREAVETLSMAFVEALNRLRIEERLKKTLKELERSNAELKQFAHVASHDLQEPLRMVSSYMQLLEKRFGGGLEDDAKEFFGYAVEGAQRMKQLIDDLLVLSTIDTRGRELKAVDSESVARKAAGDLRMAVCDAGAEVTIAPLPVIMADESQLYMLFLHLLDNAIKFRGEDSLHINIGSKLDGDEHVFSVRDNGIGIEPEYHERIFVIFQRLHARQKYPGSGIGLALCRKIVERHGGRIWVESTPGEGSTFYFTIPVRRREET